MPSDPYCLSKSQKWEIVSYRDITHDRETVEKLRNLSSRTQTPEENKQLEPETLQVDRTRYLYADLMPLSRANAHLL